jgi:type IV pilus assembly protein PilM
MSDETSIWKKEISFRKKPKQEAPTTPVAHEAWSAEPDETSVWKKEIGFRKKPKPAPLRDPWPEDAAPAVTPQTSVWKKEISFRRKKSDVAALPVDAGAVPPLTPQPAPVVESAHVDQPVVPVVPPEVAPVAVPPTTPQQEVVPPPLPQSTPAPAVSPGPSHTPEAPEAGAPTPPAPLLPPVSEPHVQAAPVPPPVPLPVPVPAPVGAPEPQPEPVPPAAAVATPAAPPASDTVPESAQVPASNGGGRRGAKGAKADKHSQLVGLKIGASQIAAAQVVNRGGPRIVRMARMPLQRGVVVGGELREPEELAAALKAFFKKNKLPRTNVRLGISNNRIGVRTFDITGIDDPQQLANAVRFRAQETLPIPLEEAVLDHRILDDWVGADGVRVCRVLLVVAHRELVERYVGACRKAGLKLVGIDLEAFALLRALNDPEQAPGEDAAVVCVSIGHDRSTLAVSDGRVCEFTRVLAWGGSALDGALARVLDLTPSAVVPIKHQLSLSDEGEAAGLDARHADEARRAMVAELQTFARELVASLRFYQEQPKSLGIVEILVTGGAATCGGLAAELERLIGIPVRIADPLVRVKARKGQPQASDLSTASMAVAVGLGIED